MTVASNDPHLHWTGDAWLWWNGSEWLPAEHRPAEETPAEDTAASVDELPAGRPDVAAAVARMGRTLGIKRELRSLADRLHEGEVVQDIGRVEFHGHGCMLAVTNRRLLFVREGMVRESVEEIPLHAITAVASHRKLANGVLEVTVAGTREKWPMTSASHTQRVSDTIRRVVHDNANPPAVVTTAAQQPTQAPPTVDPMAQLRQLAELRDAGIISAAEFETKKAEMLARI